MMKLPSVARIIAVAVSVFPFSAFAQDGTDFSFNVAAESTSSLVTSAMNNIAMQNTLPPNRRAPGYGNTPVAKAKSTNRPLTQIPALQSPSVVTTLRYRADPLISRAVVSEIVGRVERTNATAGPILARELSRVSIDEIYAQVSRANGLPPRDPSTGMAMYLMVGWTIANNDQTAATDPLSIARLRGLQAQVTRVLSSRNDMVLASNRQRLDEEFVLLAVILESTASAAKTNQNTTEALQLSNGVHLLFLRQFGLDLRKLNVTRDGFVGR